MSEKITIFGHKGFIGSKVLEYARIKNFQVITPQRNKMPEGDLGRILYCIGVTGNFFQHNFKTIEAHVQVLKEILATCTFESLSYLSSTRVYMHSEQGNTQEDSLIRVNPLSKSCLYNISKLMGESLCFSLDNKDIKVLRLSNIFGTGASTNTFIGSVLSESTAQKVTTVRQALESEKDYLHIDDAVRMIYEATFYGESNIYNIASGQNTSHQEIVQSLIASDVHVDMLHQQPPSIFPTINTTKIKSEFNFKPSITLTEFLERELSKHGQ